MDNSTKQERQRTWLVGLILMVCYLAVRLPHLRDLPVFADEATYARWGQVIAADPWHNLWVSMQDAKLPLHYWLLALTRGLDEDPITAGRLLSVWFGAAMIPLLLLLCRELAEFRRPEEKSALPLGALACGLMITCPLIAMQQRMALAEPLLLTEAVALAWLSLRLGRLVTEGAPRRQLNISGITWGLVWGLTLLTKQNFSYLLAVLLPLGIAAWMRRENWRAAARRSVLPMVIAAGVGLAMFVPVLFTDATYDLRTRLFYKPVFYPHFVMVSKWTIAMENVVQLVSPRADQHAQWWPHDPMHPLDEGWLYVYLTPPVFLLAGISLIWMARRKDWKPLAFLGGWCLALLGGLLATAGVLMSRYTAMGTFPLLLMVAWMIVDLSAKMRSRLSAQAFAVARAAMLVGILIWPTWVVVWNAADWRAPTLAASDVTQHITRYSSGTAAEEAVLWLREQAKIRPITVITGTWIGLPNDLFWLTLEKDPNIHIYWADSQKPLQQTAADTFICGTQRWVNLAAQPVTLDPREPVYYFVPVRWIPDDEKMEPLLSPDRFPPGSRVTRVFTNPPVASNGQLIFKMYMVEIPHGKPGDGSLADSSKDNP